MGKLAIRQLLCAVVLLVAACTSLSPATPTPPPPTSTVRPATATTPPTATSPSSTVASEVQALFDDLAQQNPVSGAVLVARQGEILFSSAYGLADRDEDIPNTPETRFRIASITKSFTAMGVLILEDQGKLHVDDSVCEHLPDCPASWQSVTLHHLLTHTAGIGNPRPYSDLQRTDATPSAPAETMARVRDSSLRFEPGESWDYSNTGYVLLGYIIEEVSGQSYGDFLEEFIFTPLEMHDTGYDHESATLAVGYMVAGINTPATFVHESVLHGAGALYSTVEDLFRWQQALTREGPYSPDDRARIFTPYADIDQPGWSYGYGWFIGERHGRPLIESVGSIPGYTSFIFFFPDEDITFIALSNQDSAPVFASAMESIEEQLFADP